MNCSDLISVVVPVYCVEKYLNRCVSSLVGQTYEKMEIILVDDGSPDKCPDMCDVWAEKDERIKVIHKENGGLSDARNVGIEAAHGVYIMFVDSDDYIDPNMVEKLYAVLIKEKADMSMCAFLYVDENGNLIDERNRDIPVKKMNLTGKEAIERLAMPKGWYYTIACCKLYKKSLFDKIRFPYGRKNEDVYVAHLLFGACDLVASISEPLYYYVQRDSSITGEAKRNLSIHGLDHIEAEISRALYAESLGLKADAGHWYFTAAIGISAFMNSFVPNTEEEKRRIKELYSEIRKHYYLVKYCESFKDRCNISIVCISPRIHRCILQVICRKEKGLSLKG